MLRYVMLLLQLLEAHPGVDVVDVQELQLSTQALPKQSMMLSRILKLLIQPLLPPIPSKCGVVLMGLPTLESG
jgi:hypothetical protein